MVSKKHIYTHIIISENVVIYKPILLIVLY